MPANTAAKRYSAMDLGAVWRGLKLVPVKPISVGQRLAAMFFYAGMAAARGGVGTNMIRNTLPNTESALQDAIITLDAITGTGQSPRFSIPPVKFHELNFTIVGSPISVTLTLIGLTAGGGTQQIATITTTGNGSIGGIGIFSAVFVDVQMTGAGTINATYFGRVSAVPGDGGASSQVTLQSSQVSGIANATTTRQITSNLDGFTDIDLLINFTGPGAVTGTLQIFVEDSADGGTTWDDLIASQTFTFGAAASAQHFFISGKILTTATQGAAPQQETLAAGTVRNGPWGNMLRIREKVSGVAGSPTGVTYTVNAVFKP